MRLRFWQRATRDAELDEEIRGHLDMAARDRVARGEPPEAAGYAARREFGNVGQVKETTRQMWAGAAIERWLAELRHALRRLRKSPGFALAVIASLALGIGADVMALGLADSLLFRPPAHVKDVDRVVDIRIRTYPDYVDLRDHARSFSGVAAWYAPPVP